MFLAVETHTSVPVGYVWAFVPQENTVACGVPLAAGTFFRFDAFTAIPHRRNGVSTLVRWAATKWAAERGCEQFVGHYDASDEVALLTHKSAFSSSYVGNNYLLRVLGAPVLSVTNWIATPGIIIHYLPTENAFS